MIPGPLLRRLFFCTFIITGCFSFFACTQKPLPAASPAFYYWKSIYRLSAAEKNTLQQLQIRKLYVKFFDVTWNAQKQAASPAAVIAFSDPSFHSFNIVPVVFITNETLVQTDINQIGMLAMQMSSLLHQLILQNHLPAPDEIQFDCDWTATTREKYFSLLKQIRQQLNEAGYTRCALSATIRLYQYRYRTKTGIPPVNRGLLMCYNMGNLKNIATGNSILDADELKSYLKPMPAYPLPLDVAFPLFSWKVLFHENMYAGLIKDLPSARLQHTASIAENNNRFTFLKDTVIDHYVFRKGDVLRDEQSNYDEIRKAAAFVHPALKTPPATVALFHLDSIILSKYPVYEMEAVFHRFD